MIATRTSVKFHHTDSVQNASSIVLDSKESACSVGDLGSIPGLERSLEKGRQPISVFLPGVSPWTEEPGGLTVHGVTKSWTQLSYYAYSTQFILKACDFRKRFKPFMKNCVGFSRHFRYSNKSIFWISTWVTQVKMKTLYMVLKLRWNFHLNWHCIPFNSVTQSCLTLCDPMDCSTADFPVHHQLMELVQIHDRRVSDDIQPSHPTSSRSPPTFHLSQHQGLFKWVSSSHQVVKVLEFQLQHQSFQWIFRTDFL